MAITPFKVVHGHPFWYQSKAHIYNFLLVINTNLPQLTLTDYMSNFRYRQGVASL